jgi:hypothetical protein
MTLYLKRDTEENKEKDNNGKIFNFRLLVSSKFQYNHVYFSAYPLCLDSIINNHVNVLSLINAKDEVSFNGKSLNPS